MPVAVNPYDFQNPVTDPRKFAGREAQLADIRYYLDQALNTRPTNIAVIGSRGAGKTSLLNMIEHDAAQRGLLTVRINFDESHGRSQLAFFFHLFDCLVNRAFDADCVDGGGKCFGGPSGAFARQYIRSVYEFATGDLDAMELMFPIAYAAFMRGGRTDAPLPQQQFERDLRRIAAEVGRPIVLIMDECNVIADRREILQAMRNLFQAQDRYMLVLTGTDALFPMIDDVFSPVGRGFKRIAVTRYEEAVETFECMRRPLEAARLSTECLEEFQPTQLGAVGEVFAPQDLRDLHGFTGGSPHEVQLACHFMYRQMIASGETRLSMSEGAIEAAITDLSSGSERQRILERWRAVSPPCLWLAATYMDMEAERLDLSVPETRATLAAALALRSDTGAPRNLAEVDACLVTLEAMQFAVRRGDQAWSFRMPEIDGIAVKYLARGKGMDWNEADAIHIAANFPLWLAFDIGERASVPQAIWARFGLGFGIPVCDWRSRDESGHVQWRHKFARGDYVNICEICLGDEFVGAIDQVVSRQNSQTIVDWRMEICRRVDDANSVLGPAEIRWTAQTRELPIETWFFMSGLWAKTSMSNLLPLVGPASSSPEFHESLAASFLAGGNQSTLASVVRHAIGLFAQGQALSSETIGFLAVALALPGASSLFPACGPEADSPLRRYNAALARVVDGNADALDVALAELEEIAGNRETSSDAEGYRALVELSFEAPDVLCVVTSRLEGAALTQAPRLRDFVARSRSAILSAKAAGLAIRVRSAENISP